MQKRKLRPFRNLAARTLMRRPSHTKIWAHFFLSLSQQLLGRSTFRKLHCYCSLLLVVGIIGEYAKSEPWKKHLRIFELLVTIGVAGELFADGGVFLFSRHLQTIADQEIADLTQKLGDAKTLAEGAATASSVAQEKVGEVAIKADALTLRMTNASTQLGQLESDIIAQGPRWRLLERAAPELVKQLASFAGQKVDLFVCGTRESASADREMMSTWGRIADLLENRGANWSVLHGGLSFWDTRPLACEGIVVYVSAHASKGTMEAAKVLSDGLARTLPPSTDKILGIANPDWESSVVKLGLESGNAPWVLAAKDPDLITVFIGTHPQTEPSKSKTHKKAKTEP